MELHFLGGSGPRVVHTHHLHGEIERQRQSRYWQEERGVPAPLCGEFGEAPGSHPGPDEEGGQEPTPAGLGNRRWKQPRNQHPAHRPGPQQQEAEPPRESSSRRCPPPGAQPSQRRRRQPGHGGGRHRAGAPRALPCSRHSDDVQEQEGRQEEGLSKGLGEQPARDAPAEPPQRQFRGLMTTGGLQPFPQVPQKDDRNPNASVNSRELGTSVMKLLRGPDCAKELRFEFCLLFHASKNKIRPQTPSFLLPGRQRAQSQRWTARNVRHILGIFSMQWRQIYSKVLQTPSEVQEESIVAILV